MATEDTDPGFTDYDYLVQRSKEFQRRQREGKVVVWPSDRELQVTRQGRLRYYLNVNHTDTCLPDWAIKVQEIPERSGRHRHQGGVIIFVLDGNGKTVMNGVEYPWKTGDLILLPFRKEAVDHQHFNETEGRPAIWAAYSNSVIKDQVSSVVEQIEDAPVWRDRNRSAH